MLARNQAQPGGQVTPMVAHVRLWPRRLECWRKHRPHACDVGQALARLRRGQYLEKLCVNDREAFVQPDQWLLEFLEQLSTDTRQVVVWVFQEGREARAPPMHALGHHNPVRTQKPTPLVAQRGALLDEQLSGAMQRLDVLVLDLFDGYKAHVRATHGLTDRCRIIGIIFVALAVRRYELWAYDADIMPQLPHLAGPIVCTLAGFHADTTGRKLRHKGQELGASELLAYHSRYRGIEAYSSCTAKSGHAWLVSASAWSFAAMSALSTTPVSWSTTSPSLKNSKAGRVSIP